MSKTYGAFEAKAALPHDVFCGYTGIKLDDCSCTHCAARHTSVTRLVGGDRNSPAYCFACGTPHGANKCVWVDGHNDFMAGREKDCACLQCKGPLRQPLRDRNSAERKAEPVHSGVLMYFPDALAAVSRISKAGNDKHNPGEPLHWARGKSTDQMDCLARHALTPEGIDPDSGEFEQAQVAWRALAQLQLMEERRLTAAGIRPYSGVTP